MDPLYLPLKIYADDEVVEADVVVYEAGSNALVLVSACAELDLEVHSAYLTHSGLESVSVSELVIGSGETALGQRSLDRPGAAIVYEREQLLDDHLQAFKAAARDRAEASLRFEGVERSAAAMRGRSSRSLAPAGA